MSAWFQSPVPIPVAASTPRPGHNRNRTRARVRETLTSRVAQFVCSFLLTLLLIAGIIVFILWLSLRPHRPRFYLADFSAPVQAQPSGPGGAAFAFQFNVTDRNSNQKIGIFYDAMFGSVYYNGRLVGFGPVLFPFYQPPKNTTAVLGMLNQAAPAGDPVWAAFPANAAAGSAHLRLELNSTIRFKVKTWDTHQHRLHVDCDFAVGPDGNLLPVYKGERCSIYF